MIFEETMRLSGEYNVACIRRGQGRDCQVIMHLHCCHTTMERTIPSLPIVLEVVEPFEGLVQMAYNQLSNLIKHYKSKEKEDTPRDD